MSHFRAKQITQAQSTHKTLNLNFSSKTFCWFHFLKCGDFMLFFVIHHTNLNIFGFWTVERPKQDTFLTFITQSDQLLEKIICRYNNAR